jgi:hypothetical protein
VTRTYPIRVAGNSGPMPGEITWPKLYRVIRAKVMMQRMPWPHYLPVVSAQSLKEYEERLAALVKQVKGPELDIDAWSDEERYIHRVILSEGPSQALREMSEEQRNQLQQFFEMTTVTRKVRRVASLNHDMVEEAIRLNGCHEMWITFLNYEFPQLWGATNADVVRHEAQGWLDNLSKRWQVPIVGVSTEREARHHLVIEV